MEILHRQIEHTPVCVLLLAVAMLIGCGDGRPKRVSVTGTVTYQNKPVEGARVTFVCTGARPASSTTDSEGRFQLGTYGLDDGAVLGTHAVTVVKTKPVAGIDPKRPSKMVDHLLPAPYRNLVDTRLTATVTADGEN